MSMKCERCGKEMTLIRELTKAEKEDWAYVCAKSDAIFKIRQTNLGSLPDSKIGAFFRAVNDKEAEVETLRFLFIRKLCKELGIEKDIIIIENSVYVHE